MVRVHFLLTFLAAGFLVGAFVFSFDFFADGFLAVLFFGTEALCFVVDFFSFLAGLGLAAGFFFAGDILAAGVLVFFSDLAAAGFFLCRDWLFRCFLLLLLVDLEGSRGSHAFRVNEFPTDFAPF